MVMDTFDPEYKGFLNAARYHDERLGTEEIADRYGCSTSYIYQVVNGMKEVGRRSQIKFVKACGFNTISDFVQSVKNTPTPPKDSLDWRHDMVTRKFQSKELAIHINELLVEIEKISPIALGRVGGIIEDELKKLKQEAEQKGRTGTLGS